MHGWRGRGRTEVRKTLQIRIGDSLLVGTLHEPSPSGEGNAPGPCLLLLSFGQQPRSWVGDLGVAVADRVVEEGYRVFRFDMPGLGDSPGDLPVHLEVLWRQIQLGLHAECLRGLCLELKKRYAPDGFVIGGFCGGAVTALFSTISGDIDLRGLLLLEPEIALTNADTEPSGSSSADQMIVFNFLERKELLPRRLSSAQSWKKLFSGKADFKFWRDFLAYSIRRMLRRRLRKMNMPPETNHLLIEAWNRAREQAIPTLVLSVGTAFRRNYYKSYGFASGRDDPRTRLRWIEVPNTTHAMLEGGAKDAVREHVARWFRQRFV
jgi:pimeloyl-ACP methyl ester carboxylesterase